MAHFTLVHVAISLIGILSGFVALRGLIGNRLYPSWTRWFLATTFLTSATGFFFPNLHFTPAVKVGILSLVLLAVACFALYGPLSSRPRSHCTSIPSSSSPSSSRGSRRCTP